MYSTLYVLDSSWMSLETKTLVITHVSSTSMRISKQLFMKCGLIVSSSNLHELVRRFSVFTHMMVLLIMGNTEHGESKVTVRISHGFTEFIQVLIGFYALLSYSYSQQHTY